MTARPTRHPDRDGRGRHRVAVTGLGVIAPPGATPEEAFAGVVAGRSAVRRLEAPWAARLASPVGAVAGFDGAARHPPARLRMLDRVTQLALAAAAAAVQDAAVDFGREDPNRCGVFLGTGMGGAATTDDGYETLYARPSARVAPYSVLAAMNNAAAAWIGIEHGIDGPNLTFSTACSSSAVAIGEAARRIRHGEADLAIAGGTEAPLTLGVLRAWEALKTVAVADADDPSRSCRPFSRSRSGLVLGEGAACVILESFAHARARGATWHAELAGYGLATDRLHIARPSVEGQAAAMRAALADAALDGSAIDYVNAHGTGTTQNDAVETAALKAVFGARAPALPVSSTKAVHGHLLGAAGALEFLLTVLALRHDTVPPTMHLDLPDPDCDLDYVSDGARRGLGLRAAMSSSFAFGGTNAVLVARRGTATRC
ncbi:MAG: beta-ketoacyl-[acyl-carrier-protein] synthase family protein [Steroidobacteraceae bacterium]|nr:beta-ketoacyl-[acyl-carrier-protein] synthase family protein [Steroidobacteraceae bacterium]